MHRLHEGKSSEPYSVHLQALFQRIRNTLHVETSERGMRRSEDIRTMILFSQK